MLLQLMLLLLWQLLWLPLRLPLLLLLLLLLRIHDLLVPLLLQLLQRDVGPDARLLLLNGRAVDGVVKVNGGVVVELAQPAAAFRRQVLAALV